MAGFANVGELASAVVDGRTTSATIRKSLSANTSLGFWQDLSMAPGIPNPQYYAATPLVAATLDGIKGIYHGGSVDPQRKYVHELAVLGTSTGFVGTYVLQDYLLFYPFIDLDDTSTQTLDNTVALPRYSDGDGVQAMFVNVAPTVGGGSFTFDYVNQDGVPQTSATQNCSTGSVSIGQIITSHPGTVAGKGPFLVLNSGDTGIRSITGITMLSPAGGLGCLVLVKPITTIQNLQINTPAEQQIFQYKGGALGRVYDGAYLNFILHTTAASTTNVLVGRANFLWG